MSFTFNAIYHVLPALVYRVLLKLHVTKTSGNPFDALILTVPCLVAVAVCFIRGLKNNVTQRPLLLARRQVYPWYGPSPVLVRVVYKASTSFVERA